jgi:hypothetical protein
VSQKKYSLESEPLWSFLIGRAILTMLALLLFSPLIDVVKYQDSLPIVLFGIFIFAFVIRSTKDRFHHERNKETFTITNDSIQITTVHGAVSITQPEIVSLYYFDIINLFAHRKKITKYKQAVPRAVLGIQVTQDKYAQLRTAVSDFNISSLKTIDDYSIYLGYVFLQRI